MSKTNLVGEIPFVDLHAQYLSIKQEIDHAIASVIDASAFVRGPYVDAFEQSFAELMERKHCVSCANGTDALYISMIALGINQGDEVIVPSHSWISTTETVSQAGGKVVFCDTDEDTFTIDAEQIESKITSRTVGIIPVHLFGQPARMDRIMEIAKKHNLWVLEDCAQSHLAKFNGQLVGTFGDAATFSFYPGKNLGAMGDAGAIVTNDQALSSRMSMYARHGGLKKGEHKIEGINSRMDGLQAAILSVKMGKLKEWTELRQQKAKRYSAFLDDIPCLTTPYVAPESEHVWHLYVIKTERRNALAEFLSNQGIQTVVNYPVALPFLDAYSRLRGRPADFPSSFSNQSKILSLPIFPELSDVQMDRVISAIGDFYR